MCYRSFSPKETSVEGLIFVDVGIDNKTITSYRPGEQVVYLWCLSLITQYLGQNDKL